MKDPRESGYLIGSEPLEDVRPRNAGGLGGDDKNDGKDTDGTDGADSDGADSDGTDSEGADSDGTDSDGTDGKD
ncbi:MAG TPA: hypothetical protein VER03_19585 [Bryobacteraceae bacterium]|nr:hypothetical protein [Bryobacteraceae bacterium]